MRGPPCSAPVSASCPAPPAPTPGCRRLPPAAGIDDPYDAPDAAEVVLEPVDAQGKPLDPPQQAAKLLRYLQQQGYLKPPSQ
jgi:hypothetical protein